MLTKTTFTYLNFFPFADVFILFVAFALLITFTHAAPQRLRHRRHFQKVEFEDTFKIEWKSPCGDFDAQSSSASSSSPVVSKPVNSTIKKKVSLSIKHFRNSL